MNVHNLYRSELSSIREYEEKTCPDIKGMTVVVGTEWERKPSLSSKC